MIKKIKNNKKKIFYISLVIFFLFLALLSIPSLKTSHVIISNNKFAYQDKKVVFNAPLVYVRNFQKGAVDSETLKINRELLSPDKADLLDFSKFNGKNKQVEYVKSDMEFTIVRSYKVAPTYLAPLFKKTYIMYILKDEDGLLSTMPAYENKNPTDIYPVSDFDNSYINIDKAFVDSIYKTEEKYPIVVNFTRNADQNGSALQKNFYQYIRPYGGGDLSSGNLIRPYGIENVLGNGDYSFSFDGGIDAILFLYTSKKKLSIEKIYIDKDKI